MADWDALEEEFYKWWKVAGKNCDPFDPVERATIRIVLKWVYEEILQGGQHVQH